MAGPVKVGVGPAEAGEVGANPAASIGNILWLLVVLVLVPQLFVAWKRKETRLKWLSN